MTIYELMQRIRFWKEADRIGPDIPYTHWRLHFKSTMLKLCKEKFRNFDDSAEFRPGAYAICCSKISLGKRVVVRPTSMLFADPREGGAGITIEDDVMMGSGVHIYVNNHRFDSPDIPIIDQGHYVSEPVVLQKGCWLGANVIVLPGVTIGENSVVGAGSLVTRSIPACHLAAGNPARIIKNIGE
jgi:acetyltransferase-like isoleucine patch superfamily enzyme